MSHWETNMDDPAPTKRLIELARKAVEERPFTRPGCDSTHVNGVLNKLRKVWERHPDLRLAQLVFNVSGATQPCPEIFYLEDGALLRGLDSFESRKQSDET